MIWLRLSLRKSAFQTIAVAAFVLAVAPAEAQQAPGSAPAPQKQTTIAEDVARMFQRKPPAVEATPAAVAAPVVKQRRKKRVAKSRPAKSRPAPVAEAQPPVIEILPQAVTADAVALPQPAKVAQPAEETDIIPVVVRTVREIVIPDPDVPVVSPNELSDIDMAARPDLRPLSAQTASAQEASTDGRSVRDAEDAVPAPVFAETVTEAPRPLERSAWIDALLILMAGTLATFSAVRLLA